jgi:hypothetical protein
LENLRLVLAAIVAQGGEHGIRGIAQLFCDGAYAGPFGGLDVCVVLERSPSGGDVHVCLLGDLLEGDTGRKHVRVKQFAGKHLRGISQYLFTSIMVFFASYPSLLSPIPFIL